MDEFLFSDQLRLLESIPEPKSYIEILNYQDPLQSSAESHSLSSEDFENFLSRKGAFSPLNASQFSNGIRLVYQQKATNPRTFASNVVSLPLDSYESLVRKMHLPLRALETSAAVGPFFWWTYDADSAEPTLQLVFRKSDVQWRGTTRGWEMILSYSYNTRITSGYVKGTASANIGDLLRQLAACARPAAHPLLLPILMLTLSFSARSDQEQRDAREQLRRLERGLSRRYTVDAAAGYKPDTDIDIDAMGRDLTNCKCEVLQKRPQAWRNVVRRVAEAMERFWSDLPDADRADKALQRLHRDLLSRLDFLTVKLEGLENYTHVSLERLNMQREVMHSIINQRESRLSLRIAAQQHRLADASKRDSSSMKTLTFLGSIFLPGTFVSSLFSMSFFDFSGDRPGTVSRSLWVYFVITVPLTIVIVGFWWRFDQFIGKKAAEDEDEDVHHMEKLEATIMKGIRKRTGARISTWEINPS
ncbi:hypothetical protein F5X99DRAFT_401464 [Biscogniauxia marginata]|nr:hypothetical protein F5X99DRAFT_401464 [Biscogniauxia marginata]